MSDILQQLLKAGIVSKEEADRAAKPPPRPPGRGGSGGPPRNQRRDGDGRGDQNNRKPRRPRRNDQPRESALERSESIRAARMRAEEAAEAQAPSSERDARAHAAVSDAQLDSSWRGAKRWYFEARDGTVPSLDVSSKVFEGLLAGLLVIVESPVGERSIIPRDVAGTVRGYAPLWLRNVDA